MDEGKLLALLRQVVREELGASREDGLLKFEDAANRLSVSVPTLRRMIRSGELLSSTASKSPRIPLSEIRRLATPSASRPMLGQRVPSRASLAKLKAESLGRKSKSIEEELAELAEIRRANKKR